MEAIDIGSFYFLCYQTFIENVFYATCALNFVAREGRTVHV